MGQGKKGLLRCPWPLDLYELHYQKQKAQHVSLFHGRKVEGAQWSPPSWFSFFPSRFLEVHPHMHTHVHTLLAVLCIFPTSPSESLCFLTGHPSSSVFIATKTIFPLFCSGHTLPRNLSGTAFWGQKGSLQLIWSNNSIWCLLGSSAVPNSGPQHLSDPP